MNYDQRAALLDILSVASVSEVLYSRPHDGFAACVEYYHDIALAARSALLSDTIGAKTVSTIVHASNEIAGITGLPDSRICTEVAKL